MSGWRMSSKIEVGLTEPPYWMRTDFAASLPFRRCTVSRTSLQASWASAGVAVRPVPIAQIGS